MYLLRRTKWMRLRPVSTHIRHFSIKGYLSEKLSVLWTNIKIKLVKTLGRIILWRSGQPEIKCAIIASDTIRDNIAFTQRYGDHTSCHEGIYPQEINPDTTEQSSHEEGSLKYNILQFEFLILSGDGPIRAKCEFRIVGDVYIPTKIQLLSFETNEILMTILDKASPENETRQVIDVVFREKK